MTNEKEFDYSFEYSKISTKELEECIQDRERRCNVLSKAISNHKSISYRQLYHEAINFWKKDISMLKKALILRKKMNHKGISFLELKTMINHRLCDRIIFDGDLEFANHFRDNMHLRFSYDDEVVKSILHQLNLD